MLQIKVDKPKYRCIIICRIQYVEHDGVIHMPIEDEYRKIYGATILYCTTPAKANEYATKLAENHHGNVVKNERFSEFIEHLKRNYNIDGSMNGVL